MAASEALRLLYGDLVRVLQEPELLACDLYAEEIVPEEALEEVNVVGITATQKRSKLLSLVRDQIAVHPERLHTFVHVLKKQPPMLEVAERLEEKFRTLTAQLSTQPIPPAPSQQQPPSLSAIETYAHYLKVDVYSRQKFPTYGKWPPNPAKKYINLALIKKEKMSKEEMSHFTEQTIQGHIDDIVHEKESISMETIGQLKGNVFPKCILVEGAPGVGKSTFVWMLCRKWSKGKLLRQYRLVVLLRLRDKRVREAKSVSDLFYYYNRKIQQIVVEEIEATGGRGVLLLFEGYDELPARLRTSNSIFLDVIKGQELPTATVLITSRPSASGPLYEECRDFIGQHVEILGFTDENIQSYLKSTTSHDPSLLQGLQQYLTYYPHVRPMLYVPLNCAIVVEVYRVHKSSKSLIPKTWTDLYSSLLRSLLLRYLDDHPVYQRQSWKTNSFRDLPADVYQQLCEVGRIAYEGILQDQQVIFSDLPSNFDSLGLMQCVSELYVDEVGAGSFNFLHLTLQEYMAAFYLSEQSLSKQVELFRNKETRFQTVLRFLAGLTQFTGFEKYTSHIMSLLTDRTPEFSGNKLWISLDGLHWMFEAACSNVCKAIGTSVVGVDLRGGTVTSFDSFVLGYCVSHSNCPWEVNFANCGIGDEGMAMLVRGAMEGEAKHSGYISVMNMYRNKITSTGLNQLLKIPELLKPRQLNLSGNTLGRGGAVSLLKSPLVHNLERVSLRETGIGVEDCQALLSAFPTLKNINISDNALTPEAVELIITGLKNHTVLEKLEIRGSKFNLQNCISLASVTLPRRLILKNCHIDDESAIVVAGILTQNRVTSLRLGGNCISVRGASEFAGKLLHNTSLRTLDLKCESIGLEGTQKLIDCLSQNSTLKTLGLPGKYESAVSASETYQRVKDRVKWERPIQYLIETDNIASEPPPVSQPETLPSSSGGVIDTESCTGEEQADISMAVPARGEVTEEGSLDTPDSEAEDWVTPPTSRRDSLDSEVEDWKTPPTSPTPQAQSPHSHDTGPSRD